MGRSKNADNIDLVVEPRPFEVLRDILLAEDSELGPCDQGTVDLIVLRPEVNARNIVSQVYVEKERGMVGSGWELQPDRGYVDQICVMSSAAIRAIAGEEKEKWAPAGDQLFIDMNLSKSNLEKGQRVRIGEVLLEVTPKPHNGCLKFKARYGNDALRLVNALEAKERRIRGIYFSVIEPGMIKVGDRVTKV